MSDQFVQTNVGAGGAKFDTEEVVVGANTVERQRIEIAGAAAAEIATIKNADQGVAGAAYGLVTRLVGKNPVVLYDDAGNPVAVADAGAVGSAKGLLIVGSDGANYRLLKTDTAGRQVVVGSTTTDPGANPPSLPTLGTALVSDVPQGYTPDEIRPLSMNQEGRLRVVAVSPAPIPNLIANPWRCVSTAFGRSPWKDIYNE